MIWTILLPVFLVFCVLMGTEYVARTGRIHAELTRKFVHMTVGTFVAFWPFFLSWPEIVWLSVAFLAVILVSIKWNIFQSIHNVDRNVWGEIWFAIAIGLLVFASGRNQWIFMAAMLNLSLADGLAATVGITWGDTNRYRVFGWTKSRAGTAAFFVTSVGISASYVASNHSSWSLLTLVGLPLAATAAENLAVLGADNLVMPLLVAGLLRLSL